MLFLAVLPESLLLIRHLPGLFGGFPRIYGSGYVGAVSGLLICNPGHDLCLILMGIVLASGMGTIVDKCSASAHILAADGNGNLTVRRDIQRDSG